MWFFTEYYPIYLIPFDKQCCARYDKLRRDVIFGLYNERHSTLKDYSDEAQKILKMFDNIVTRVRGERQQRNEHLPSTALPTLLASPGEDATTPQVVSQQPLDLMENQVIVASQPLDIVGTPQVVSQPLDLVESQVIVVDSPPLDPASIDVANATSSRGGFQEGISDGITQPPVKRPRLMRELRALEIDNHLFATFNHTTVQAVQNTNACTTIRAPGKKTKSKLRQLKTMVQKLSTKGEPTLEELKKFYNKTRLLLCESNSTSSPIQQQEGFSGSYGRSSQTGSECY